MSLQSFFLAITGLTDLHYTASKAEDKKKTSTESEYLVSRETEDGKGAAGDTENEFKICLFEIWESKCTLGGGLVHRDEGQDIIKRCVKGKYRADRRLSHVEYIYHNDKREMGMGNRGEGI